MSESTGEDFPLPVSPSAVTLANVVSYDAENALSAKERELHQLLSSPHISAIIATHDKVANKEYPLQLAEDTMDAGKGSGFKANGPIRVVYLRKKEDPLVKKTGYIILLTSQSFYGFFPPRELL